MFRGCKGSKSRLAEAAGAEPPGGRRDWKLKGWTIARRGGAKHISTVKMVKAHHMLGPLLQTLCIVAGALGSAPCQKWAQREGFVAFPCISKNDGRRGTYLKRICKDAFSVAGAVQETCSSELLGGPGADFLRGVPFWSIRSPGLLRWFCVTGAALRMAWPHSFMAVKKPQKKHWHEAASSALNFPCLKEVSRNCLFVFDVVNFKNGGSLAEYRRFGAVNFHFLKKSRRLASFWSCQPSLLKEVSQNGFLSDKKIDG